MHDQRDHERGSAGGDPVTSFVQRRMWFLQQLVPDSSDQLLPLALRLRGNLDVTALREAWTAIVDRHDVLRTRFVAADGEPVPRVDPAASGRLVALDVTDIDEFIDRELRRAIDLATEHPVRATLARLAPDDHVLLVVAHHIAVDGRSWDLLVRELQAAYAGAELSPAPVLHYTDVARRQRERLAGPRVERLLGYWRDRLDGVPALALPTDRPRPAFWDGAGDVVRFTVPADLVAEVDRAARSRRCTRYMLLLAVYQALLACYSRQSDIAVCTTLTDRGRADEADVIGPFVNTVVLRGDLSGRPSFDTLARRVRDAVLADFSHAQAPFDQVVAQVGAERDLSRHPLAQASFTLLTVEQQSVELPGLDVETVALPLAAAPMDVFLDMNLRTDGTLAARLQYSTTLFDRDTMEQFAQGYLALLRSVLAAPEAAVADLAADLDPLPGRERRRLIERAGATTAGRAAASSFAVSGDPDAVALECGDRTVRYGELDALSGGVASALEGTARGAAVGVCVGRGVWSVAAMLAVWRAGGTYVPLDSALPAARLAVMVAEAGVEVVVHDAATEPTVRDLPARPVAVERCTPDSRAVRAVPDPSELAYVIFTSGSSGRPKAVGVEHGALAAHVAAATDRYGVSARDRVLAFSSFSFDASFDQLLPALGAGATVVVRPDEQWSTSRLLAVVHRHAVTVLNLPPTYWAELTRTVTADSAALLASVRLLILGGEAVPATTLARWREQVPRIEVCNAYGPTEAVITATTCDITTVDGAVPIGGPLGGRSAFVVDARGDLVADDTPGELWLGGGELARGYLGRPGATADRFVPDGFGGRAGGRLYRTGDLVRRRPDGELEFLGRVDDQVKVRGFRIELGEVDAALAAGPGVAAAAAAVRPDAQGGATLVGYLVPVGAGTIDAGAVRERCRLALPHHMVPTELVVLDALPVTTSGKLDRAALPAPDGHPVATRCDHAAPRDATERAIARIFGEVLGLDRVGLDDGFFDLGGHSLLAAMAVSRIAQSLDREIELRTLFENPRVRDLAPVVAAAPATTTAGIVPVDRSGPLPMSFAQERLWFLDRMSDPDSTDSDYVLRFSWRVRGGLDRAAWQGALDDVVARHEVLRTALTEIDGRPVQQVRHGIRVPLEWHAGPAGVEQVRAEAARFAGRRFDLAAAPLLRAGVWELGPGDCVAVLAFHHVATDGWSSGVVADELARLYGGRVTGRPAGLPPLPVQYGDYAVWQRRRLSGGVLERELDHWRAELDGVPALELPTDRARPPARSGRGGVVEAELDPRLLAGIDELARRGDATRFMVLLAAFQVVLARWSGQDDIAVGTPVAGRGRTELEQLVGFFVNTVVLRGDVSGGDDSEGPSFRELLGRVRATTLGAFDHQDVPFERLVQELRPERDLSRNPLFQVMFDVQEITGAGVRIDGLDVESFPLPWSSAKFDLTANVRVGPGRLALDVEYSTDLFEAASVRRFADHLRLVLESAVADPDRGVVTMDLLAPGERAALIGPPAAAPVAPAAVALSGDPADVALVCDGRTVRYAELDGLVGGLARSLTSHGVRHGSAVGVCVGRGMWSVAAMLAVWRSGGVYVPLDPRFPAERLRYMSAEAGLGWVVHDAGTAGALQTLGARTVAVEDTEPLAGVAGVVLDPRELAYVIFTSGSTGRPKAVGVEHGALAAHVAVARELFGITARDRVLSFASLSFDASLEQILPALTCGARVVLRPDEVWTVAELAARVRAEAVTLMEVTPTYWEEIVARLGDPGGEVARDLAALRLLVSGGEVLPAAPLGRWFDALPGVPIVNTYGPTESVISATAHLVSGPVPGRVPIGVPLGSRRVHVVDARGELVPVGVPGELLVGGPELARGYLGRPGATADRFVPDPFGAPGGRLYRTGDRARWRPDGGLEFLGRVDDQIKIRGFRIEPGEITAVLGELPGVVGAAVHVRELRGDRALVAHVAGSGLDADALRDWCARFLPSYLVPSVFVLLDALPMTVQGKLDVAALPDPEPPAPVEFLAPRTPTEVVTAQVWAEVLGVERVGLRDDFFALGGHSLRAVAVAARLRAAFDCPVLVRHLFESPTVEQLALELERQIVEQISAMSDDEIDLSLTSSP